MFKLLSVSVASFPFPTTTFYFVVVVVLITLVLKSILWLILAAAKLRGDWRRWM